MIPCPITRALLVAALALLPRAAYAQHVRPWTPPNQDSVTVWAAEARTRFQTNQGDSVGGANFRAYDLVGAMGRRLLRALGKENAPQAHAVETVLDSLGLDTEIALDPENPGFMLLMVHNPFRLTAKSVGFLYWFRGNDLRIQGVLFEHGKKPAMKVWWTTRRESPYECGIIDRSAKGELGLLLLKLNTEGYFWAIVQFPGGHEPDLGIGSAAWVDIDRDGRPELAAWVRAHPDSSFEECEACSHLYTEAIYTEREDGFGLHDSRLLPSPWGTFTLFIRLLRDQNRAAAARLLLNPAKVEDAIAQGWGSRRAHWSVEYQEQGESWPEWFAVRRTVGTERPLYIVHFVQKDGRWVVRDWIVPTRNDSTVVRRPR